MLAVNIIEPSLNIAVVYKQPVVNGDDFIQIFNSFIDNKGKMIAVGDMNINLLNSTGIVNKYIDSLTSTGFALINSIDEKYATRVANRTFNQQSTITKSIIDHVITNCSNFSFSLSMNDSQISDHKELMLSFDDQKKINFLNIRETISYSKIDKQNYNAGLHDLIANRVPDSGSDINTFIEQLESVKSNSTINITHTVKKKSHEEMGYGIFT